MITDPNPPVDVDGVLDDLRLELENAMTIYNQAAGAINALRMTIDLLEKARQKTILENATEVATHAEKLPD